MKQKRTSTIPRLTVCMMIYNAIQNSLKKNLTNRYNKAASRLWREFAKSNDQDDDDTSCYYDAIDKLSDCLCEINEILPVGQEIRPTFSNLTFNGQGYAPNFAYCDMEEVTFINVDYSKFGALKLNGTIFEDCIFGENSIFKLENFKNVKSIDGCMFKLLLCELDELSDKLKEDEDHEEAISETNMNIINSKIEDAKKIQELEDQLRSLQVDHQASSSTSRFFGSRDETLDEETSLSKKSLRRFN